MTGKISSRNTLWLGYLMSLALCTIGCNRSAYYPNGLLPPAVPGATTQSIGGQSLSGLGQVLGTASNLPINPNINPNFNPGLGGALQAAPQLVELERRVQQLDSINRGLTTQLAQAQQQYQLANERYSLLAKQLQDTTGQLQQLRLAATQAETQVRGLQASSQTRSGARLRANSSVAPSATGVQISGAQVFPEGDVVRVRVPADQIFAPGTAQLNPSGSYLLDQVAATIQRQYPRQRVGIEGHTDTGQLFGGAFATPYQLAGAQAQAVMDQLVRRNNLPTQQLFTIAHGPNHAVGDNNTANGRAENRRIEFAIYPETF